MVYKVTKEIVRKYYKYGTTPNAIIVGNPTITNGIASNFAVARYLTLPSSFPSDTSSFEMVFKTTTGSVISGESYSKTIFTGGYNANIRSIYLFKRNTGVISIQLGTGGSSYNIGTINGITLTANTTYYFKLTFNGSLYDFSYSTDGLAYTSMGTIASSLKLPSFTPYIGMYVGSNNDYSFNGSVDLTKSYIKINNTDWWHGTLPEPATEDDYDYYKDVDVYKSPLITTRKYYKYQYSSWTQPTLTSNGTMGGDSFATSISCSLLSGYAYYLFDKNTSTKIDSKPNNAPQSIIWYNPNQLNITKVVFTQAVEPYYYYITEGYIQGSNDMVNWTNIKATGNTYNLSTVTVDMTDNTSYYYYHRLYLVSVHYYSGNEVRLPLFGEITLTAQQRTITTGTSSDYDFYEDVTKYYASL